MYRDRAENSLLEILKKKKKTETELKLSNQVWHDGERPQDLSLFYICIFICIFYIHICIFFSTGERARLHDGERAQDLSIYAFLYAFFIYAFFFLQVSGRCCKMVSGRKT